MAGYFIELLKCQYPDAIVAYFFCRSGQKGLFKARDIIRTLAYQVIQESPEARLYLESLQREELPVDDNVGVGFLFDKLLKEPLATTSKTAFIILDGLDEADRKSLDSTERPKRTEIEILLQHLANLPSSRLLIISRAEANVARTIPTLITKTLSKNDNTKDIDTYVRQTIQASSSLKTQFEKENVDPSKYFHDNANGIFLWVVIVLHQLAQAKSRSKFQKYLTGFSDASGSLEQLYSSVLHRIEGDDQTWIKEILKWVVVGYRSLSVDELREVVGILLEDELQDFQAFLEVEAASLLHLIPNANGTMRIELIHETLQHFLTDPNLCPDTYCIDEQIAHTHALGVCLEVLSGDKYSPNFTRYAAEAWSFHVSKLEGSYQLHILGELREFFDSGGCMNWIRLRGFQLDQSFDAVYFDELADREDYNQLTQTFEFFKGLCGLVGLEKIIEHGSEREMSAIKWAQKIVDNPGLLGEYVGKAAGEIWLYEDLSWVESQKWFSVVLNYYLRRGISNVDEVDDISENCFERIVTWCGVKGRLPNYKNIAVGYFMVGMWDECVACFERTDISTELYAWVCVGMAYLKSKDYIRATEAFERTITATSAQNIESPRLSPAEARLLCLEGLSQVYVSTGILNDHIRTLDAFQALVTSRKWAAVELLECLTKRNNSDQMKIFETALYEKSEWWADSYFARAGLKNAQGVDTSESGGDSDIEGRFSAYGASGDSNLLKPVRSDDQLSLPRIGPMGSIGMSCSPDHDRGDRWVLVVNVLQQPFDVSLMHALQVPPGLVELKLSPDCKYLGAHQWSGDVRIFDTMSGARVATVPNHTLFSENTRQFAFSRNSKYLLLSRSNNLVRWFDIETRQQGDVNLSLRDNVYAGSMKFSCSGNYLIRKCSDGTVKIWSVSAESPPQIKEQASLNVQGIVSAISADGELIAGNAYDDVIGVWETATGKRIGEVLYDVRRCTYTRLENALVVQIGRGRAVICRKPSTDSCLDQLGIDHERSFTEENIWSADCSPGGEWIIIGCGDGSVRLWKDGVPQFALKCHDGNSTILFIC